MMHMHDTSLNITQSTDESDVLTSIFFSVSYSPVSVIVLYYVLWIQNFVRNKIPLAS